MDLNEEMKKYMEENKQVFLSEMNKIHKRLDKIDNEVEGLKIKLEKHISFIDETYEGLRNPIEGVKKWLGR
jgi:tetrahydromethanopterin S-methyltransferase subunit G